MKTTLWASLTLSLICSSACRSTEPSQTSIAGGSVVKANDEAAHHTVALIETDPVEGQAFCTGVLIAPNVVLTAAHCFGPHWSKPALYFGTRVPAKLNKKDARVIPIDTIIKHPGFDADAASAYDKVVENARHLDDVQPPAQPFNDLALIPFVQKLPSGYSPLPIAAADTGLDELKLQSIGFGCVSSTCKEFNNTLRMVDIAWRKSFTTAKVMLVSALYKGDGTCLGDSGGPDMILKDKGAELLGIITTGPTNCEGGLSVDTLIPPYADWIKSHVQELTSAKARIRNNF